MLLSVKVENEEKLLLEKTFREVYLVFVYAKDALLALWLSDKIRVIIENEEVGRKALKIVLVDLSKVTVLLESN